MIARAYGLGLASEIELPHLRASPSAADINVRFGLVTACLNNVVAHGVDWQAESDRVLVTVAGVGRFLTERQQILVTAAPNTTQAQVAFVVMHACLAPLLHLRGTLVLHAAAVDVPGFGVVGIAGPSASGKSTLLMACVRRQWRMVTDELAAIRFDTEGNPWVAPGPPVIHVWRDALEYFKLRADELSRVRANLHKYEWPVPAVTDGDSPLRAIVLLEPSAQPVPLCRVEGAAAFVLLRAQLRSARIGEAVRPAGTFSDVTALAARVPIFRLGRPDRGVESVEGLANCLASLPV